MQEITRLIMRAAALQLDQTQGNWGQSGAEQVSWLQHLPHASTTSMIAKNAETLWQRQITGG